MQKCPTSDRSASWRIVVSLLATLLFMLPGELATADKGRKNRGNRNNRNAQQAAARARAAAAAKVKQLTAQLKVVDAKLKVANQRLMVVQTQMQALHIRVTEIRKTSDAAESEKTDARLERTEIEKQLEEEESPGSNLGQAKAAFELAKTDYFRLCKELAAKLDRQFSATEREKIVNDDLEVVLNKKVLQQTTADLNKVRKKVFEKSPDWRNANTIVFESAKEFGTAKRTLDDRISEYNKVRHYVLGAKRDVAAMLQAKQSLEAMKSFAQKKARSTGSSKKSNNSGKKKK